MKKLDKIANKIQKSLFPTSMEKLTRLSYKVAQFLEENPYSVQIARDIKGFLERSKQVLLLNSGLSGMETYVDPADVRISVKPGEDGFVVTFNLPEIKTSESKRLTDMLTKNIYNLLERNKEYKGYSFIVIVSS